jgi:hypothetical protein
MVGNRPPHQCRGIDSRGRPGLRGSGLTQTGDGQPSTSQADQYLARLADCFPTHEAEFLYFRQILSRVFAFRICRIQRESLRRPG